MKNRMVLGALVLSVVVAISPLAASAAFFKGGEMFTLHKDEKVANDLYTAGGNVAVIGDVAGDVVGAAGDAIVSGNVTGDVLLVGGSLLMNGTIGDDLRGAAGKITVSGSVGDDLVVAGGQVYIIPGAEIGGDLVVAGGQVVVDGVVKGNVRVYGGQVEIGGRVDGEAMVKADDALRIGDQAMIAGKLTYRAAKEAQIPESAKIGGGVEYAGPSASRAQRDAVGAKKGLLAFLTVWWTLMLLAKVAAALALFFIARRALPRLVNDGIASFGKETVRGLVLLVVLPVAIILAFVSVVGWFIGAAGVLLYVLLLMLGSVTGGILLGTLAAGALGKGERVMNWKTVTGGVLLLSIVGAVPFIGWIVSLIFFLAGTGIVGAALWNGVRHAK